MGNASFSNDLPNISNLCKFQDTTSTGNVHDTLLLPLSEDTNLTNIEKSNNSIGLINSIPTNYVLMSSCNIAISRNTQSLTSCHETWISYDTHGNSVIANTTSANINTSSDNMLTSVAPTKLADDVYKTSNKEEVFNQTHTPTSFDRSHAFSETSSANLSSGFLHEFMECVQLRRDDFASVINLSVYPLTVPQLRVLSRGLKFTPLPHSVDRLSLRESIAKFERSLRLAEFFHDKNKSDYDNRHDKFRPNSSWTPITNRDKFLDSYISTITSEIMNAPEHKSYGNLSFEERSALKDLKSNVNLVIREADKGCSVVVMDRQRYIEEGYRQLNDTSVYLRTRATAISDIQRLADQLHIEGVITDDIRQFAIRRNTKPVRFYLFPKVHKKGVPGRPVVSACGSATEGMSEIVDFFLQPYMPIIPSSIKDTDDFIRRIRNIIELPSDVLLVTLDVVSLYPSIPHDFGLCALKNFLLDRNLPAIVVNGIHNMTEMVLKKNVFEFNSECFLQISGTAIGTKMAPAYANIVMSIFERKLLTGSCNKPFVWFRYIDDIFAIWTYGEDKLKDFMLYINSIHSSFQFTCNYSKECVQFLDVSVSVDNSGNITTDLYVKPTDTQQYLMATSCHPNHTKRSIPYSQALRILRICSSKELAKLRRSELVDCLVKRGYNKRKTNKQIERAFTNFANPPTGRQCHITRPVYFDVQFHPGLPDIKGSLQRYMPLLHQSVTMKTVVPDLPLISFSQPHNLCRRLCRAKLRQAASVNDEPPRPSQSCGKSRCKLCLSLICSNYISGTANNKTIKCYNENTSCDSKWIIYVISCPIYNLQYVGQSNNFRARMNGHKSDFRLYAAGKINNMDNKLPYDHLICHDIDYFHVSIVDMIHVGNNTESQLDELLSRKERKWIWDLCSITPYGLNQDDGYYCQNKRCRKR